MAERQTVAVLTRAIPVEGYLTDTCVKVLKPETTVADIQQWADNLCAGNAHEIRLEIVLEHPEDEL